MMAIEILECDPTVWSDQSFFNVDNQIQHDCGISSKLGSGEQEWGVQYMKDFLDSLELDFNNEPDFQVEVMPNEVDSQTNLTKAEELDMNYLTGTAFLSPISMAPSSPEEQIDDNFDRQLELESDMSYITGITDQTVEDLDNTSAMDILDKILSAHSSDNEDSQEEIFDSAIDAVQYFAEVTSELNIPQTNREVASSPLTTDVNESNGSKRKRQVKRKAAEVDSESRGNKRTKRSIASLTEKKERKKDQNKSAANRYRIKKRAEQETIDVLQSEQNKINEQLRVQLEKLQMEFKVVYPLAKAAFASDPKRNLLLQMLNIRVLKDNLLD